MMQLIRKQVQVPDSHTLQLSVEVPAEIPSGPAEVMVMISPASKMSQKEILLSYAGCLAGVWEREKDSVALQRELRDEWE